MKYIEEPGIGADVAVESEYNKYPLMFRRTSVGWQAWGSIGRMWLEPGETLTWGEMEWGVRYGTWDRIRLATDYDIEMVRRDAEQMNRMVEPPA